MNRHSLRFGSCIRSLFARATTVPRDMARKSSAVRHLNRLINCGESHLRPTQILTSRGLGGFARFRLGVSQGISVLTIRNPFGGDHLERARRAFSFSFVEATLENRQLLASFSYSSGLLTVRTNSTDEQLSIISTSERGNYTITTSGVWSGTAVSGLSNTSTSLYVNQPSGLASILVNDNNGTVSNSSFRFGSSSANFVNNLTVNFTNSTSGVITVANSASFINGKNLNLTTTGNQITVSNLTCANSTGSIRLTGRNFVVTGNITTGAGDIFLTGNTGSYSGSFDGVCISGSTVNVNTTSGNITIDGRAGGGSVNEGVNLTSSKVQSSVSGCVTITGMSGNGSGSFAYGIFAFGATVTTNSGLLTVNGTSCGTGCGTYGVYLKSSANISATGMGNVTITGIAACGTNNARGIKVLSNSKVTTNSGLLTVNGTSNGTGTGSKGVCLSSSSNISATGAGNVTITGSTPGNTTTGVGIDSSVTTAKVYSNGGLITLNANSLGLTGTVNATTAGNVTIQPIGNGTLINLGNGTDTNTALGLSAAEIGQITAGTLTIGSSTAGNITVSVPISWPTNLTLITGGGYFGLVTNLTVSGTLSTPSHSTLVTNANDSGSGSLREALATASTNVGDDQISFDSNLTGNTISLLTPLTINDLSGGSLYLTGPGASNLSISGGGSTGIFSVYSPASLSGLTLTNGTGANGTSPNLQGGAIFSNNTLSLTSVTIHNSTANFGSAIYETGGSLTLKSSNIENSVYITGSGNLTVFGGSIGSNVTVENGNTLSITDYTRSLDLFSFNWNSIVLSNITAPGNLTVVGNTSTSCISVTGPLSATGANSISLTGRNIVVNGNITAQAGDITLYGNGGGSYQAGTFDGVCISGSTVNVNTMSGNITIDGLGGGGSVKAGVNLTSSTVQAGGLGCVTITGMSGNGSTNNAYGINASGAIITANSGSIAVNGTSCGRENFSLGVRLASSANVSATGTGNVTITGNAANGTNNAYSISISGSTVLTNSGSLTVNGTSCGTGTTSIGVRLASSANVSATGTGNVTITGNAANGTNNAYGIYADGSTVLTNSGSLTVNGTSCGTGTTSIGVVLTSSANVSATGTGNLSITGTAANGTNNACGIYANGSTVTTTSGSLTVNGTSCGTGTGSKGVYLISSSNISATGAGNLTITGSTSLNFSNFTGVHLNDSGSKVYANGGLITLTTSSVNMTGTVNATSAGNVLIQTLGAGVDLGNGTDTSANLGLSQAELNQITANMLTIGNSTTGAIVNTAAISRANLTLISGNSITQTGAGNLTISGTANFVSSGVGTAGNITLGNATNDFATITASGTNISVNDLNNITIGAITSSGDFTVQGDNVTSCISVIGPVNANSGSGNVSLTGRNIVVTGNITTAAGDIRLYGNGGNAYQAGTFDGVCISGSTVNVNTTSGNITIDGRGASLSVNAGVNLQSSKVQADGSGCVTITGVSGNGTDNAYGIYASGSTVTTSSGSLTVNGSSCGTGFGTLGVYLASSANISATGAGNVTITGTANGTHADIGINVNGSKVTTNSGSITVNGTSYGTDYQSSGVVLGSSNISATGTGNVTITGTAANGTYSARPYFSQEKARFLHLTLCFARASDWPTSYICSH